MSYFEYGLIAGATWSILFGLYAYYYEERENIQE